MWYGILLACPQWEERDFYCTSCFTELETKFGFDPFPYEIKTIPERGHCELILKAKSWSCLAGHMSKKKRANGVTFALAALSNRSDWQYHNINFTHKLWRQAENPPTSEKVTVEKGLEAVEHNGSSNLQVQEDQLGRVYHLLLPKQLSEQKTWDLAGDEQLVLSVTILDATATQWRPAL